MRKLMTMVLFFSAALTFAQSEDKEEDGYKFQTVKEIPITSIKNQNRSGTCWAYSSLGFFEAELLRLGKGEYNLCEMYLAHKTYEDRAKASVRLHGDISFSEGGSFYDAVYCMQHYGMVPEEAMPAPGSLYGDTLANFTEFFPLATKYVESIAKSEAKQLSPAWMNGLNGIFDAYLGKVPETFTYKGKTYTPQSFQESLGLNLDDYVSLTSYNHHPFYKPFIIEIQDNWRWGESYNLPIDELMQVMDNAINNGYTFAWGSDVSETGFTRNGLAVFPDTEDKAADLSGSDMAHWLGLSTYEKQKEAQTKPCPEKSYTQEERQRDYDNWTTTDDHGMLIYGIAKDVNGTEYFMVKNSWGDAGKYKGIWYASKPFVRNKTMNILVHKDAVPKDIKKKLGIK
jgi:aminopeptidase C